MIKRISSHLRAFSIIIFLFFATAVLALATQVQHLGNLDWRILGTLGNCRCENSEHYPDHVFTCDGNYCVGSTRYVCVGFNEWRVEENSCSVACTEACQQQGLAGTCDSSIGGLAGCSQFTAGGLGWDTDCVLRSSPGGPASPVSDCPNTCTCYTIETTATNCEYGCDENCQCLIPDDPEPPPTPVPTSPPQLSCPNITRTACGVSGGVNVHWTGVTGADLYRIYRNNAEIGTTGHRSYADTTAPCGQTLTYRIDAISASEESAICYQNVQISCPCSTEDPCPTITITSGDNQVTVGWSDTSGASLYRVYRDNELIQETTNLSCTDEDVTCGDSSLYSVRPIVGNNEISCEQNVEGWANCPSVPEGECLVNLRGEFQPNQEITIQCIFPEEDNPELYGFYYQMTKDGETSDLSCDSTSQTCGYVIPDYGCYTFTCKAEFRGE